MASMFPNNLSDCENASEGERFVYSFLKETAKPHRDFICWYRPEIQKNEPDFIVFCRRHGLIVIEVKDWAIQQIKEANPESFTLFISGKYEKRANPFRQAKGYVHALMAALKKAHCFASDDPSHSGKLKVPISRLVAFPNIQKSDYCQRGLEGLIPLQSGLFKDDFEPLSEIWRDTSGKKFHEKVCGTCPFPFEGLRESGVGKLTALIWPEIRIDLPERKGMAKERFQIEVRALDEAQAKLALYLKPGHQIIKGPPGCGKTLVLVSRCCQLRRYSAAGKKILLVCFNIVLKNYLVRLMQEKGLGVGEEEVQVHHFFELCSRVLNQKVEYEKQESQYYESVVELALEAARTADHSVGSFDAILVDEGQDFSNDMFKILIGLLKPKGDLVIALDDFQDLYRRKMSWKSLGVEAQGRSRSLPRVYRNTAEIHDFARRFIGEEPEEKKPSLFPDWMDFHGESPQMVRFKDRGEEEDFLVADVKSWLATKE